MPVEGFTIDGARPPWTQSQYLPRKRASPGGDLFQPALLLPCSVPLQMFSSPIGCGKFAVPWLCKAFRALQRLTMIISYHHAVLPGRLANDRYNLVQIC